MPILDNLESMPAIIPCQECGGSGIIAVPSHRDPSEPESEPCRNCDASGYVYESKASVEASDDSTLYNEPF